MGHFFGIMAVIVFGCSILGRMVGLEAPSEFLVLNGVAIMFYGAVYEGKVRDFEEVQIKNHITPEKRPPYTMFGIVVGTSAILIGALVFTMART